MSSQPLCVCCVTAKHTKAHNTSKRVHTFLDHPAHLCAPSAPSTQPTFAVLHTLSKVKYDHLLRFTAARIILDFIQLLLLVLRPAYGESCVVPCFFSVTCTVMRVLQASSVMD